jgi:hypothetical protein
MPGLSAAQAQFEHMKTANSNLISETERLSGSDVRDVTRAVLDAAECCVLVDFHSGKPSASRRSDWIPRAPPPPASPLRPTTPPRRRSTSTSRRWTSRAIRRVRQTGAWRGPSPPRRGLGCQDSAISSWTRRKSWPTCAAGALTTMNPYQPSSPASALLQVSSLAICSARTPGGCRSAGVILFAVLCFLAAAGIATANFLALGGTFA